MEDRIRFIEHQSKQILFVDFSDCTADQVSSIVDDVVEEVGKHARSSVLILADFTHSRIDKPAAEHIKKALVMDRPYVKRSAWVGTDGLPKVFFENFKTFSQRQINRFDTREQAMEWLVSD